MIIDTHVHYNLDPFFPTWKTYWDEAQKTGVTKSIVVGTDEASNQHAIEIAQSETYLFSAVGIHPEYASEHDDFALQITKVESLLTNKKVVAIGECGLDYFRLPQSPKAEEIKNLQKELFTAHVELAKKHNLPLIIHCRDAYDDMLALLQTHKPQFVLHCMSGTIEYLNTALALGGYISFAGNVTYPKATAIQELAQHTPLNRMFIETDAPYLPPQAHRGETCRPAYIAETAQFMAELLKLDRGTLESQTTSNAQEFFHI